MKRLLLSLLILAPAPVLAQADRPTCGVADECKESRLFRALGMGVYATKATDAAATEWALRTIPGAYEGNPLLQRGEFRVPLQIVVPVVSNELTAKMYRDGHKRKALWIRVGIVAFYGYLTAHNLRQGR